MPNYIRARVSGGTFFFTVTLADRSSNLLIERVDDLRASFALVQRDMPFQCDAMVVLPDHLHAVWTLPDGDDDFSTRWKRIKAGFSKSVGIKAPRSKRQEARLAFGNDGFGSIAFEMTRITKTTCDIARGTP